MKSFLLLIGAVAIAGCGGDARKEPDPPVVVEVKVATLRSGSVDRTVAATGELSVLKEAQLRSPVAGFVLRAPFFPGDAVKRGDIVAVVRSKEAHAAVQGAEEMMRAAPEGADKERARASIEQAEKSPGSISITAPFDGVIGTRARNPNEVVAEGEPIASVLDPHTAVFLARVPASAIHSIRIGQRGLITFSSAAIPPARGTVSRIDPQVTASDQTVTVQITPDFDGAGWERGLFGTVDIVTSSSPGALLAPRSALLRDDETNTASVMLAIGDSLACKIQVTVGSVADSLVQVSSPFLKAGSAVIVEGHYGLPDSTRIRVALNR